MHVRAVTRLGDQLFKEEYEVYMLKLVPILKML
jgi:hypothetical protein